MKFFLYVFVIMFVFSCTQKKINVLNGKIDGLKVGDRVFLSVEDPDGSFWLSIDSVTVTKDGQFSIKNNVTDCYVKLLHLKQGEQYKPTKDGPTIFIEGYATLNITGNVDDWYYIKASGGLYDHPDMEKINQIKDSALTKQKEALKMLKALDSTKDTVKQKQAIDILNQSNSMLRSSDTIEQAFLKNNTDMAYSAALLRHNYNIMSDFDKYEKTFNTFSPRVQSSPAGILIRNYIANVRASEVGKMAPDFSAISLDKENVALSKFKGKYILLDFWGSWCGPCRESSPQLVNLYNQCKENNVNIEFIGIACNEQDDEQWKKAINNDNLSWIHVNDSHSEKGKSIRKGYAVLGVPHCVLISPEGEIILREHPLGIVPKISEMF